MVDNQQSGKPGEQSGENDIRNNRVTVCLNDDEHDDLIGSLIDDGPYSSNSEAFRTAAQKEANRLETGERMTIQLKPDETVTVEIENPNDSDAEVELYQNEQCDEDQGGNLVEMMILDGMGINVRFS